MSLGKSVDSLTDPDPDAATELPWGRRRRGGLLAPISAVHSSFARWSGVYVWLAIIVIFSIWTPSTFDSWINVVLIVGPNAATGILALAVVVTMATGAFDISLAATMTWSITFVTWLMSTWRFDVAEAILLTLSTAVLIGAVNAFIVVRLHVSPIITTLGMSGIVPALAFWLTNGQTVITGIPNSFTDIAQDSLWRMPAVVLYMLIIGVLLWYFLGHTTTGRYMYATGGNPEAALLAGVRVNRMIALGFVVGAVVASCAGILLASQVGSGGVDIGILHTSYQRLRPRSWARRRCNQDASTFPALSSLSFSSRQA